MNRHLLLPIAATLASVAPAVAPTLPFGGLPTEYSYVELADMAMASRIVLSADIVSAVALKGENAAGVAPGQIRYFVTASVTGLISGQWLPPAEIRYLVDIPTIGKKLKLAKIAVLLLAVPGERPGEIRLIGPRAQVPRTSDNERRVRAILTAAVARDAPPAIRGIGRAFHVAGSLPGEGETQIFVRTADGRPISLSILRRPGEQPRWAVALSELVDASAEPPPRESFLWYRLSCGLPSALPDSALAGSAPGDAEQARTDYRLVLDALGTCTGR